MQEKCMVDYAIEYADMGFAVFPLRPKTKLPIPSNGFHAATTDATKIRQWWEYNPTANIGIATGQASGGVFAVDLDIDEKKGINGLDTAHDFMRKNGDFPETAQSITGRGGLHQLFRSPNNVHIKTRTGVLDGVDIRGDGGYIAAPPSVHENGNIYQWEFDPSETEIAVANKSVMKLVSFLSDDKKSGKNEFVSPKEIKPGQRNDTLMRLACSLQARGLDDSTIAVAVENENKTKCTEPLNSDEVNKIVSHVLADYPKGARRTEDLITTCESSFVPLIKDITKDGSYKIRQCTENSCIVLRCDEKLAGKIKYNTLSYSPYIDGKLPWSNNHETREWQNVDDANLRCYIEHAHGLKSRNAIADAFSIVSSEHSFNPVVDYLDALHWDGVPRISLLLSDYLGTPATEYAMNVMHLFMWGAVARAYEPGVKFDYMPVLVGEQGLGKSVFLRRLAINPQWYSDNFNSIEGDQASEKLRGMWIVELAELLATKKAKEIESIKAFITSTIDTYRVPYGVRTEQRPRVCVFAGTTNNGNFLTDRTGNRRYLPIDTNKAHRTKSLFADGVENEFSQAWAEAVHEYKTLKPELILPAHLEAELLSEHKKYTEEDARIGIIQEYLDTRTSRSQRICVMEICACALNMREQDVTRYTSNGIHEIMQHQIKGWQRLENNSGGRSRTPYGTQICYERIDS